MRSVITTDVANILVGVPDPSGVIFQTAMKRLVHFFQVTFDCFDGLSKETIIQWSIRTLQPKYQLTWSEHSFLIGQIKHFQY